MQNNVPKKLYKYISQQYVSSFINGEILFRNLESFRQMECSRGDALEGEHIDNPDNDITIHDAFTNKPLFKGDASFHRKIKQQNIFIHCLSLELKQELFDKFECSHCIEITDVTSFISKFETAILKRMILAKRNIMGTDKVYYYSHNEAAPLDINQGWNIAYLKRKEYALESEYRIAFGRKKDFDQEISIQINNHPDNKIEYSVIKEKLVNIGSLKDIIKIHTS